MKMFNIIDPGTNANLLGGAVGATNVYVALYPAIHDNHKAVADLEIGESTQATYNLSGTNGVYLIVRALMTLTTAILPTTDRRGWMRTV